MEIVCDQLRYIQIRGVTVERPSTTVTTNAIARKLLYAAELRSMISPRKRNKRLSMVRVFPEALSL